jgi:ferredoxin-NADP reductase
MNPAIVCAARALTPTVTQYWLTGPSDGPPLPPAVPGQHVTLRAGARTKTYTVVAADDQGYELAIRNRNRGGRGDLLSPLLYVGAAVTVTEPGGHFTGEHTADFTHFVAGGVGVNPVLAVLAAGRLHGWRLVYVDRGKREFPFLGRIQELAREQDGTVATIDTATQGRPDWDDLIARMPDGSVVGLCGPVAMVGEVSAAVDRAVRALRLVVDGTAPATGEDLPGVVEVECISSGVTFQAGQERSLLDELNRNGIAVPSSCRQGICGTCEIEVRSGVIDHRDEVLTDEEKAESKYMLPCVSKSVGRRIILNV